MPSSACPAAAECLPLRGRCLRSRRMRVGEQLQYIVATSDLPPHPKERFFEPILFFLCQKEKNGFNLPRKERWRTKPYLRTVPPSCDNSFSRSYLPAPGHLTQSDYAPHAILMMAVRQHPTDTVQPCVLRCTRRGGRPCPPVPPIFRRTRRGGRLCPPASCGFLLTRRNAFLNPFFSFFARKKRTVSIC